MYDERSLQPPTKKGVHPPQSHITQQALLKALLPPLHSQALVWPDLGSYANIPVVTVPACASYNEFRREDQRYLIRL